MKIYNTLNRKVEEFKPVKKGKLVTYHCGPTVYWNMHLGNMRSAVFADTLKRSYKYLGYDVNQIMNFTDVGHLTEDSIEEDKMEKASKREGKDIWKIAETYIKSVLNDYNELNLEGPTKWVRATDHIQEMIDYIKKLEENGYTYETKEAVYFDVSKYPKYTQLQGGQLLEDKKVGVREGVSIDIEKKHPADFALWVKCVGKYEKHIMRWESPWGVGFPGWHIECSVLGTKYLGDKIDIHSGGEDLIPTHHTNEIAQNFGVFGHEVVNYWMHNAFILIDSGKMSKSLGNVYELKDIKEKGFDPMDLKYFYLTANYRTRQNFTWDNLKSAQIARKSLVSRIEKLRQLSLGRKGTISPKYKEEFIKALEDDLNTPLALSVVWEMMKDEEIKYEDKFASILDFDQVLGLRLDNIDSKDDFGMKAKVEKLLKDRDKARNKKEWEKADKIRDEILKLGVKIEDTEKGTNWIKK